MEGLTLSTKEQNRLHILNGILERHWSMKEAAPLLGVSERQGWRLLAAYRREGARGLVHQNRGRVPPNATPEDIRQQVVALAQERFECPGSSYRTEFADGPGARCTDSQCSHTIISRFMLYLGQFERCSPALPNPIQSPCDLGIAWRSLRHPS